jgi:uracil-DNA glycosylase family 4
MLKRASKLTIPGSRGSRRTEPQLHPGAAVRPRKVVAKVPAPAARVEKQQTAVPTRIELLANRIRICTQCPLCESRILAVPGEGKQDAQVMLIGEAPGKQEDELGKPFVGNAGRYLEHVLAGTDFQRADFFITNIVKCRPPSNRTPKSNEVATCTSLYLFEQVKLVNPKLVLLLGRLAVTTMLKLKSVEEARGRVIAHEGRNYIATYHPAVRFYREDLAEKIKEDFGLLKRELKKL